MVTPDSAQLCFCRAPDMSWGLMKVANSPEKRNKGMHFSQGWTLQLMVRRASMELPEFAADAHVFRPERWLNDKGCPFAREPKGFMPFGDGPRKCLGMPLAKTELRVLLAALARGFDFELEDPNEPWCMGFRPINDLPGRVWKLQG